MFPLCVICYQQTTRNTPTKCMVIITNYELIENPLTGFFGSVYRDNTLSLLRI